MATNPYAAPKANLETAAPTDEDGEPAFFPVSVLKLALMSLCTLGLYELYWGYKNWKCANRLFRKDYSAAIRAFFLAFTSFGLFKHINEYSTSKGVPLPGGSSGMATLFLILSLTWRLPDPYWLIAWFAIVPLLVVQNVVNQVNAIVAPDADRNSRFSAWNIVAVVLGGALLVLAVIGTFMAPVPQG
jgi:hypothetical protein